MNFGEKSTQHIDGPPWEKRTLTSLSQPEETIPRSPVTTLCNREWRLAAEDLGVGGKSDQALFVCGDSCGVERVYLRPERRGLLCDLNCSVGVCHL